MKNKLFKVSALLFLIFVFLLSIISVSALGVTPGRKIIDFSPSGQKEASFRIINSEDKALNVKVSVKGDLSNSFSINEQSFVIQPKEERDVSYTLTLPYELDPGTHMQEITIVEVPDSAKDGSIGAVVGVITQVYVRVPYPGKYAQVEFNIESAEEQQEVSFFMPITNLGQEELTQVNAEIEIYNSQGDKIAVVSTEKSSIKIGERKEVVGNWRADVTPGVYRANALINYDGESINAEKNFSIGNKVLELVDVNVKSFTLGGIAKFEMGVENKWGEEIKNVYSQTNVFDKDKNLIADFKSPTYDIASLSNQTFFSYWDTEGVDKGTYDASVYLRYGEKFSKKNVQFRVDDYSIQAIGLGYVIYEGEAGGKIGSNTKMLVGIIIFLLVLNLLWFILFRKRVARGKKENIKIIQNNNHNNNKKN